MTVRSYLKKRVLVFIGMVILGGTIFHISMFGVEHGSTIKTYLSVIAAVLGLPGMIGFVFFVKCPQCKRRLGDFMNHLSLISAKKERGIKHCPYCGVNFDDQI